MPKLKMTVGALKTLITEMVGGADMLEPGDLVDVMTDTEGYEAVRVERIVPDVRAAAGLVPIEDDPSDRDYPGAQDFTGPGFVGTIRTEMNDGSFDEEQMVFSLKQVVPGSKVKYYFPEDDYGRRVNELP